MKQLTEIQSRLITITELLNDKQQYPLNSWDRRMLCKEYKTLQWVITEVHYKE